jgi:hypothetical protein
LRWRRLDPRENKGIGRDAALSGDGLCQGVCLIEPADGKAAAVQGHRHEDFRLGQDFVPSARHPRPKGFGKFQPVAVFQRVHQPPDGAVLEMRDSPGAGIHRRIGDSLGRQKPVIAKIHGEGRPKAVAKRTLDKTHLGPAGGT